MLSVRNLQVSYGSTHVLDGVDLDVEQGECLAIVGESGAGKTTLGLTIMRLVETEVRGEVLIDGVNVLALPEHSMQQVRWNKVSMVFQNANNALNPVHTVLDQVIEPMVEHSVRDKPDAREQAGALLARAGLPREKHNSYPHQLSGGEQQRVLIAMALANDPEIIILDEPVSSLDATSRAEVVALLKSMARDHTYILVTHDIATAARLADRVAVLYAGTILEMGSASDVLSRPRHPYTRALLRSYPNMTTVKDLQGVKGKMSRETAGCPFHPRCTQAIEACSTRQPVLTPSQGRHVACHRGGIITLLATENLRKSFGQRKAVDGVSLSIESGETLALVGESGSGKTTLAKTIMGLHPADGGEVYLEGQRVAVRDRDFYRQVQIVFQNPGESLSHRLSVLELVREPLDIQGIGTKEERERKAIRVIGEVELPTDEDFLHTYPHHLSGGEMQRVAIARALVLDPRLLIADEPTAFLDPSLQAKIMKLMLGLQEQRGLSMLFITHDIAVARKVSDRIAVMFDGKLVEEGQASVLTTAPVHPHTRTLVGGASDLHSAFHPT
ncbi:MAG: ABC transporter ATP-binding protein [Chloroflexota bacterium]|nr:ABC transporter ATP-binding protein [Chloroflexota bacterium]